MCHNLRGRELAEEARRSCAVGNHWHGRATHAQRERDEAWRATEVKGKTLTEEVRGVVGSVG